MSERGAPTVLKREVGLAGAIMMGLGSIIGTGVFVSIGIGAGIAGPAVIVAMVVAALVAICNGLSSAQLAASHAVSGGTYEYGYKYLTPALGFTAGWMFLLAKSASAATAALGFAGYLLGAFGVDNQQWLVALALLAVVALTLVVLGGMRRSNVANAAIVSITLGSLLFFIAAGLPLVFGSGWSHFAPFLWSAPGAATELGGVMQSLLYATALMFVAYTGYGRIATLGEEVHNPRYTIPRAIITTMILTLLLYTGVAFVGIGTVGAEGLSAATAATAAPLEAAARSFPLALSPQILGIGAITAMLGVLLNLLLGLSRVLLAMGRRGDMPPAVARLNQAGTTLTAAVIAVGAAIAGLTLIGNVKTTWSFSAFTVLIYYAVTNLAALRLRGEQRLYPRWIAWTGLAACLLLAFWVQWQIWALGVALLLAGLLWHLAAQRLFGRRRQVLE